MLKRVKQKFDLHPERLIADTAYGTGPLLGWLLDRKIAPHIPVFDKSGRNDGTWTRATSNGTLRTTCTSAPKVTPSSSSVATTQTRTEGQPAKAPLAIVP